MSETPLTTRLVVEGEELLETQGLVVSRWLELPLRAPTQVPATNKGRRPKNRLQTKGADPRTGTRKGETCSSLVSWPLSVRPWPSSCLCRFFFLVSGSLVSCSVPVFFWLVLTVGVAFLLPGGRDVGSVFFSFSVDGHRPEYRLFQVSLYVCPSRVSLRARARLSCLFSGFLLLHQCGHQSLCQRALLSLPQRAQRFLFLVWCCRRWPYAHASCHRSCLTVRSTRLPPS